MRLQSRKFWVFDRRHIQAALAVVLIFCAIFAGLITNKRADAATSSTINFQARLMTATGGIVQDGYYNIEFKLYDNSSSSGSSQGSCTGDAHCLWTETYYDTNGVTAGNDFRVRVVNGYVSVSLGSLTAFPSTINWNQQLWLTMNVGGATQTATPTYDGEMSPRMQLTAVPYAFRAGQLASLAGSNTGVLKFASSFGQDSEITLPDPGASTATVCYQTASSCGFATGSGAAFVQGGNSFGATAVLGTTDAHDLNIIRNNSTIATFGSGGETLASGMDLALQGANAYISNPQDDFANSEAFGLNASVSGANGSVAVGNTADAHNSSRSVAIGYNANDPTAATPGDPTSDDAVVIGYQARATNNGATAIGSTAIAGFGSTALGSGSVATSNVSVAIGSGASTAGGAQSIALGADAATTAANQLVIGSSAEPISQAVIGNGVTNTSPAGFTLQGTGGSGSNVAGATVTIAGGQGTGTGVGGNIVLQTATAGSTGSSLNALVTRATLDSNNNLYLGNGATAAAPNDFVIRGTGSTTTAVTGGSITLQGGDATAGDANGGNVTVIGGTGFGTGVRGIVNLGPSSFTSVSNSTCSSSCTIGQGNVDNYASVVVNSTGSSITITVPDPTNTAAGRVLYVIGANNSNDFTLAFNSGATLIDIAMRENSTATLFWNGSDWTAAGAGNSTTLQAAYDNGANPSNVPEIKLDSTHSTIDIQDADSSINTDLFNIRASNSSTLGTVLFGVSDTGKVTVQNVTDQSASLAVLNAGGSYITNVNSSKNYVINNGVRNLGNDIINAGFEAGGQLTSGEQGWNGPAQGSIVNSATDAHTGNYLLEITPNATNLDVYPGTYFAVQPGDTVYTEAWVKNASGSNGDAGIQLTFYDKDYANPTSSTSYSGLPGTSYVLKTVSATVPSGKYYVRPSAAVRSTSSTGTFYYDDFYLKRTSEQGPVTFKNSADSTSAFRIQSASAAQTLFTADTTNNILKVGDSTGTNTDTTILVVDNATADPSTLTGKDGGLFYRSDQGSLKAVLSGNVYDICTTASVCTGYGASAGSVVSLQASSPGTVQTGNFAITGTGILTQLQTKDLASGNTDALTIHTGNATSGNSGNLTIDVGTASGTKGSITLGSSGVTTTMPGKLIIQGSNTLELGASAVAASIKLHNSVGSNTVTLTTAGSDPTSSWTLTLPQNPSANSGYCMKATDTSGGLGWGDCGVGATVTLQDVYNNSSNPATMTLASGKDLKFVNQESSTDPNIIFDLQCTTCSSSGGRFLVENGGTPVLSVLPNSGGVVLAADTQIGSSTTDSTETLFHLDSYNGGTDSGTCSTTTNQGALYYNTSMGSLRGCLNGSWVDVSNPDTLGLLTFGIIPSTGSNPYDLPALITPGVSGPCKVSWNSATSVHVEACVAYSGGQRVNISATTLNTNSASAPNINLTTTGIWGQVCLTGSGNQPAFTATTGNASPTANMPTFSVSTPILCLASVKGSASSAGTIDDIYDVRTFSSTIKEAVNLTTAADLGMLVDAASGGLIPSAACTTGTCSGKLYGVVIASNGSTSTTTPNAIVASVGPAFIKATAGTAGQFIKSGPTSGYAETVSSIPNNAFYYSPGNTRTSWSTTCSSASNCQASLYVNFIVR